MVSITQSITKLKRLFKAKLKVLSHAFVLSGGNICSLILLSHALLLLGANIY